MVFEMAGNGSVGGASGAEFFPAQQLDANGRIALTVARTPKANSVLVLANVGAPAFPHPAKVESVSGRTVNVRVFQGTTPSLAHAPTTLTVVTGLTAGATASAKTADPGTTTATAKTADPGTTTDANSLKDTGSVGTQVVPKNPLTASATCIVGCNQNHPANDQSASGNVATVGTVTAGFGKQTVVTGLTAGATATFVTGLTAGATGTFKTADPGTTTGTAVATVPAHAATAIPASPGEIADISVLYSPA